MGRSAESQALHDGFERHVLPAIAPLGFARAEVPREDRGVGWTVISAVCPLAAGGRLELSLLLPPGGGLRFYLYAPGNRLELLCSGRDPSFRRPLGLWSAMGEFAALRDPRIDLQLEFLGAELVVAADQLVAAVPELAPRLDAARKTPFWQAAPERARRLWDSRKMRSDVEDRPVPGKFVYVGATVAIVEAEGERHTFRFDTKPLDRAATPELSGWFTTAANTRKPTRLIVGTAVFTFDPSGNLAGS